MSLAEPADKCLRLCPVVENVTGPVVENVTVGETDLQLRVWLVNNARTDFQLVSAMLICISR